MSASTHELIDACHKFVQKYPFNNELVGAWLTLVSAAHIICAMIAHEQQLGSRPSRDDASRSLFRAFCHPLVGIVFFCLFLSAF